MLFSFNYLRLGRVSRALYIVCKIKMKNNPHNSIVIYARNIITRASCCDQMYNIITLLYARVYILKVRTTYNKSCIPPSRVDNLKLLLLLLLLLFFFSSTLHPPPRPFVCVCFLLLFIRLFFLINYHSCTTI